MLIQNRFPAASFNAPQSGNQAKDLSRNQASNGPLFAGRKEDIALAEQQCRELGIDIVAIKEDSVPARRPLSESSKRLIDKRLSDVNTRRLEQNRLSQKFHRDKQKAYLAALIHALQITPHHQPVQDSTTVGAHTAKLHHQPIQDSLTVGAHAAEQPLIDADAQMEWEILRGQHPPEEEPQFLTDEPGPALNDVPMPELPQEHAQPENTSPAFVEPHRINLHTPRRSPFKHGSKVSHGLFLVDPATLNSRKSSPAPHEKHNPFAAHSPHSQDGWQDDWDQYPSSPQKEPTLFSDQFFESLLNNDY